ncbi:MAG: TRAP transporter large permease [Salipiger thiooxidans]|jgi:C4-dicarboxylate transporter DctM subunit|uniref:TRAP transporter large permease n=1 Tax=Salipiger thiooxidans TaxID=282683 RepID=UPI001A905432|nr:TRAP transporter large permease [Salipiger thiooxidans]MBN8189109.1 TRAP transporter large permease [Salipiger thiooxidans]MBR9839226.1 TRAP transporter large permease [Paracoccaceae bacterium]MCA0847956.1 TRAP transporter large permease [Salipiger thiooxidans]
MIALLFGSLLLFLLVGVPVTFALGLAAVTTIWEGSIMPLMIVPQEMIRSVNSFPLLAIPFFILAGNLMQEGGISARLVTFSKTLVGAMTGGLAMVAIVTSAFFAAISGSGAATTAAVGAILIPAMVTQGYSKPYAASNQAASGALGVIIPPSIPLILYAISANQSVGAMFVAGVLPGLLVVVSLLIYAYVHARGMKTTPGEPSSLREVALAGWKALLALAMPALILGGIYGGIVTPTEAAVVAVVYALLVGAVIYRELPLSAIPRILRSSAVTSAIVLSIIAAAGLYGRIILQLQVPAVISDFVVGAIQSPWLFIILVNVLLLLVGMFLEAAAAILIFTPILLPIATTFGFDPVHFGVIMVVNLAMGMFTPPVGLNLFIASGIARIGVPQIARGVVPFVLILLVDLLIISFLPWLSLVFTQ